MNDDYSGFDGYGGPPSYSDSPYIAPDPGPARYSPGPLPDPGPRKRRGARRRGMRPAGVIALCLLCAVLAGLLGAGGMYLALRGGGRNLLSQALDAVLPTPVPVIATAVYTGTGGDSAGLSIVSE